MPDSKFINREISWLSFNDRVLQEAADPKVPLLERLKFLGIYSSNNDEFFRVRVATLKRMVDLENGNKAILGGRPKKILAQIQEILLEQRHKSEVTYNALLAELASHHIHIINEQQLSPEQGVRVRAYFQQMVRPTLVPIMIDEVPLAPLLKDKMIYLAIALSSSTNPQKRKRHAIIEIPTNVTPRFLVLSQEGENMHIMLLEDVIRYCLGEIFHIFQRDTAEAYTIKLTRDAELDLDDDLSDSFMQKMSKSLKQRKKGRPVRFIYDESIPQDFLRLLIRKLKLRKDDNLIPGGRYHNFKDFIKFPKVGPVTLQYHKQPPVQHHRFEAGVNVFSILRKKDILLHYPYQSFHHVIDLLRESAIDPQVVSLKMTLYRVAENSNVVNALINAVKNGKYVTVVMELQARFDEEANIFWANKLREEGAKVIFGVPHMKVHSKLCLINRKEKGQVNRYAYIGTGNFNEETSRLYSDHGLLTARPEITEEVNQVFNFLDNNFKIGNYRHLIVSPFYMRSGFISHINNEIENARAGKPAYMVLKMNSLVDEDLIKKMYAASQEGVKIYLIVRSICSLKAGVKGLSENIHAISIVDKYLEHSRIFLFANSGDEKMYIGSGDWMVRNLDHRVEVDCPVYDEDLKKELRAFLTIQLADNVKARILGAEQDNKRVKGDPALCTRAQELFYNILADWQDRGEVAFEELPEEIKQILPVYKDWELPLKGKKHKDKKNDKSK